MIDLIDVSSIQGEIDWQAVKGSGVQGVYVKCSQYSGTQDGRFDPNVTNAEKVGLRCGPYHFCWQGGDPVKQAEFFFRASSGLGMKACELPPMVDWEFCHDLDPAVCVGWLTRFLARSTELWYPDNYKALLPGATDQQKALVRRPMVYTYPNFASLHQPKLSYELTLADYPLCFAAYKSVNGVLVPWEPSDTDTPETALGPVYRTPKPWSTVTMWQYSGNKGKKVPGVGPDCDRDKFLGSSADWDLFCGIYRQKDSEGFVSENT